MDIVAVVGLGYVGLPLAVAFGRRQRTIGLDLSQRKVDSIRRQCDPAFQLAPAQLAEATWLSVGTDPSELAAADKIVVAVPTPVDAAHNPDLSYLTAASATVGSYLKRGATVVFESTVYPGVTEDICIPLLEQHSGMQWKKDFHVGYSPERNNPGDIEHTLASVRKIVAGDDPATLDKVAQLYEQVVDAGVHRVSSIRVAEAAKVIENTQRDLNIALMNELAIIFDRLDLDTLEVLEAAGTKWNFMPFRPGLVGGHCIGVDPYHLTHKAHMVGYHPDVILAGRRINDSMAKFVAEKTIKLMLQAGFRLKDASVNVLGLSFKENCADLRNSKVFELIRELESYGACVHVHDPIADPAEAWEQHGVRLQGWDALGPADAMVVAVPHRELMRRPLADFQSRLAPRGCFIDVKSQFDPQALHAAGLHVWRL